MSRPGPDRIRRLVDQPDGRLDLRHGTRRVVEAGDAGGGGEQLDPVPAGPRLGVGNVVPQVDRPLVLRLRLGEGIAGLVGVARRDRRLERARQVVGRVPVVGELRGTRRVAERARLERPRERGVQPGALARQQVVVDRLLEQRVPEGIALDAGRRVRDEDLATDALAERFVERRLVERGGGREQGRVDALAGRRCDAQELLGRFGEVGRPGQEHVAQRGGQLATDRPRRPRRAAPRQRTRCRRCGRGSTR